MPLFLEYLDTRLPLEERALFVGVHGRRLSQTILTHYLKHLPFDTLKIDGEFVRHLADSPRDQIMVKSIAELAAALGSQTVAEFVEDEATETLLREYGVDYAQGYLIGRPQPVTSTWPEMPGDRVAADAASA